MTIGELNARKLRKRILRMWGEGYFVWRIVADLGCTKSDVADVVADHFGVETIELRLAKRGM